MSLSEEQIHTLHEVISQFRVLQDALPGQLQDIRDHLHSLDRRIDAINHAVPTIQPQTNIKIRLPTTFDGRSSQCNTFFSQLSIYFAANPSYDTDERKIMLAISCVSGPVFTFLEPFIAQIDKPVKPDILINYEVFKTQITAAFGDSDPIITAENHLRRVKQDDNQSVTTYATKFRMYAQVVQWNDAALISQFKVNLNSIIQNELARRGDFDTLDNLIAEAIEIDNKLVRGPNQRRLFTTDHPQQSNTAMDVDPKSFSNISKEERERRNQSRSCYYCGDTNHFKRDCPKITSGHRLNTFVLTAFTPKNYHSAFHSLPMVNIIKETTTSVHAQIAHADNGLIFVPLVFGNMVPGEYKKVQALLDTGATHSVVSHKFLESTNLLMDTVAFTNNINFVVGNGQHVESNAKVTTQIRLSNSIFHNEYHEFHVVKDCSFMVILGIDWIQKHNVELDFGKRITTIKCADTRVCCPLEPIVKPIVNIDISKNLPSPTPSFKSCDTSFEFEILADYNSAIQYRPSKLNGAADALSRRDKPVKEGGEDSSKTAMTLLDPAKFVLNAMTQEPLQVESSDIQDNIIKGLEKDSHFGAIIAEIKDKPENHDVPSNYSLNVKQKLSTALHPQADGQTERVNSILEQYLRCYVNYQQSDWSDYLPIAQFAYNNSKHSSTDTTPFYAVFGYHSRLSVILPRSTKDITPADTRITQLRKLHQDMNFHIAHAQEKHQEFYNRKVIQGPKLNIGDKVWLSSRNIKSQRPTPKLDYKRLGPFKIISKIGSRSYKLELPSTMRIHPIFHVNLLEPYQVDTIPGRQPQPVPPIIVDEHQEYEVEDIVDSRIRRNQIQYLVHWKGYNLMDRTWEPFKNVMHCQDLLKKFHAKHPSRPRPSSLHGARP